MDKFYKMMNYDYSVPVMNISIREKDRENIVRALEDIGAKRIFIALQPYISDTSMREYEFGLLKTNIEFFRSRGFEVGVWLWALMTDNKGPAFTKMRSYDGTEATSEVCPLDADFIKYASDYIKDIALLSPDIILFDDDFRFGYHNTGMFCLCKNHLREISGIIGRNVSAEEMQKALTEGGKNELRSAYLRISAKALEGFAYAIREAINSVNESIRLGMCACLCSYDTDGTSPMKLIDIMSDNGKLRPFVRLIGAPYWAVNQSFNCRLGDIVDFERWQSRLFDSNAEVVGEGDVNPRPRFNCPAAYLECFDMIMLADGKNTGILKYVLDYTSSPAYEQGYIKHHIKNTENREFIKKHFSEKQDIGLRVFKERNIFESFDFDKQTKGDINDICFSRESKFLTALSVPSSFDSCGLCGVCFGEDAKYLPETAFENGLIIDARAAEILMQNGHDTGIEKLNGYTNCQREYFVSEDESVMQKNILVRRAILNKNAKIQSYNAVLAPSDVGFNASFSTDTYEPLTYIYENKNGERFFVLLADMQFTSSDFERNHCRKRQLRDNCEYLCGKKLPVFTENEPDVYFLCKEDGNALAIGLWTLSPDSFLSPVLQTDKAYTRANFMNCKGEIREDKIYLSDIQPYSFAGIVLEK